jgi:S-adenosylmethionine:tRNA ribosyltransferase-isomerase
METTEFSFNLPEELIAQFPPECRGTSRMLFLDRSTGLPEHRMVSDLPDIIEAGALLVFNDSKVRRARLFARSIDTATDTEFLLLDKLGHARWRVMAKKVKRQRVGRRYRFDDGIEAEIEAEDGDLRILRFSVDIDETWLDTHGHMPLPPYIKRMDAMDDSNRYQTIYARAIGSVAAPTAGLHFSSEILASLDARGIEKAFVTLHVGLGTFLPVRSPKIEEHVMHEEAYSVSEETARAVNRAKAEKRPIIAVGTTSVRVLESAWHAGHLNEGAGRTSIFIYPGYRFKVIDRLFTNFHTPESTLLMLVAAFAGTDVILKSYQEAIKARYRFFSYGDAMYIK